MTFAVNTSPFAGREGTHVTSRKIRERLYAKLERDVALRVADTDSADTFVVSGRGELHLAILIETHAPRGLRVPGVASPKWSSTRTRAASGSSRSSSSRSRSRRTCSGAVVEMLGRRRGALVDMKYRDDGSAHCVYKIPTRGLLGFRQAFLTNTRGKGVMNTLFAGYGPLAGPIELARSRVAHRVGSRRDHAFRPEQRAGARPAVHRPRRGGVRGHGRRRAHPRVAIWR